MNTKETLKRLHKKFPMMGLDELFEVLDCYVEEYKITEPRIWSYTEKTNGVEFNKNQITCSTSNKNGYGGNTITTAEPSSAQLTTSH
jgi:hypothetical protein